MHLIVAEKPSVAQSLAKVLGVNKRYESYFERNDCIVSWCLRLLVELSGPEAYDERYGKWRYEDLPILPPEWKYGVFQGRRRSLMF